jgi:hypothetical protein
LAWRLILCATLFLLCLCECVFRKIFVFVLHLLLSCAQNGSESYCCVCSLGASSWRVGRETGCAFLYGVIAIGRSLSRDAFENWWATACWVLYTSKLSSSLLLWFSHYGWSSPTLTCPLSLTTQAKSGIDKFLWPAILGRCNIFHLCPRIHRGESNSFAAVAPPMTSRP